VATAVGLAVAIPAVIAFNTFKARIKGIAANTEWLARNVLAHLKSDVSAESRAMAKQGA
jgi:biopolymer transport protein ExbB